jgi:hypothetical protein
MLMEVMVDTIKIICYVQTHTQVFNLKVNLLVFRVLPLVLGPQEVILLPQINGCK